jgi:2-methylcitrate dehydratase PrpD
MSSEVKSGPARMAEFVINAKVPSEAREPAVSAFRDTMGVILAGAVEPAARLVRQMAVEDGRGECRILGTRECTSPDQAALANGVSAHALDYDDMCFVSLAHPSCVLVPAALAMAEVTRSPGRSLVDAYVVGFEIESRLGNVMNPRHYHERGWHCTSSIGTLGAAAAASRILGLDANQTAHALGIAASAACGLKENMGTMVKPLHAGMAARNGIMAARLASRGFTSSEQALDGPQGYLMAMDSQLATLDLAVSDLGQRWEILQTGITVKLYPSCAATHVPLDTLLDIKRREGFSAIHIDAIHVEVDSITPRLLIHDRPSTGLEAKFSMPFCIAAAIIYDQLGIDTFNLDRIREPAVQALLPRVTMSVNPEFDQKTTMSHARVSVRLRDGRTISQSGSGARGYPGALTERELRTKFTACAGRTMQQDAIDRAWTALTNLEGISNVRQLTELFQSSM